MKNLDSSIIILLVAASDGLSILFLHCYFGKSATDSFVQMSDRLYECNWRDFPVHLQKNFIFFIGDAQQQIRYHGFRVSTLDLETYCKVNHSPATDFHFQFSYSFQLMKTAFSGYMMLKTITSNE